MKKQYLKYIFSFIIALILFIPNNVSAVTSSSEYTIKSYNINMIVNEDNTFDITETITAYFNVSKHGIYRKIPLKNFITRTDGTTSSNSAKITNISVNDTYSTYNESGYKVIKIGDSNTTLTGSNMYTIKYTYNIGRDPLKDADELYFNLIGDEWDTSINNVTFTITMPKSFDSSTLSFSCGSTGSTDSSNVSYTVNGNTIKGSLSKTLYAGQALTVRLTLPEGYFVGASINFDAYSILVIIFSTVCVVIAYRLWAKYGKDDEVIETVEFYPPEGYNSAEVGFLYKGFADNTSAISLLIYLANKGYLKIDETEEAGLFSKSKSFRITKIKDYDGDNECERIFIEGVFRCTRARAVNMAKAREIMKKAKNQGEKISFQDALEMSADNYDDKNSVTASDLYDNFYTTLDRIKSKIASKENKNKIFELSASSKGKWLILMIIAIFVLITTKPIFEYGASGILLFALLFPGIGLYFMLSMLFGLNTETLYVNGKPSRVAKSIFAIVWGLGFGGIPWASIVLPALTANIMYLIMHIVGIICITILVFFSKILPKRTPYGNEILGKLRGFKRFLETAEKTQLESLVEQNPEYFYNILPYTYALGVSDVWMRQFETIALQAPDWYDSPGPFVMNDFNTFMNNTMNSAQTAMSSSPSSDSDGSSGGGSGGGGGGSW